MGKQKPTKSFRAGSIRASIWENEVKLDNGQVTNMPKICVERRYKNEQGEWHSSNHFNINELAKLQAVIRAAFECLVLREREDESAAESPKTAAMYRV